ncbi:hypothetical protein MRB53_037839 [Persea americana]|nr:hypothetical protein MRB53_037839 [Persea americana]
MAGFDPSKVRRPAASRAYRADSKWEALRLLTSIRVRQSCWRDTTLNKNKWRIWQAIGRSDSILHFGLSAKASSTSQIVLRTNKAVSWKQATMDFVDVFPSDIRCRRNLAWNDAEEIDRLSATNIQPTGRVHPEKAVSDIFRCKSEEAQIQNRSYCNRSNGPRKRSTNRKELRHG